MAHCTDIPFTIEINGQTYDGYLQTTDIANPPKSFFVLLNDRIVGDLLFRAGKWVFNQAGRKTLGKLDARSCNFIAKQLENIVSLAHA